MAPPPQKLLRPTHSHLTLHTHTLRIIPTLPPTHGPHILRSHQPRQTCQPLLPRGSLLDQTHITRGEDRTLGHTRSKSHRLSHCLHRSGDEARQGPAVGGEGVRRCCEVTFRRGGYEAVEPCGGDVDGGVVSEAAVDFGCEEAA